LYEGCHRQIINRSSGQWGFKNISGVPLYKNIMMSP
jgi:hypothetical protein